MSNNSQNQQPQQPHEVSNTAMYIATGMISGGGTLAVGSTMGEGFQLRSMADLRPQVDLAKTNGNIAAYNALDPQLFRAEILAGVQGVLKYVGLLFAVGGAAYEIHLMAKTAGGWRALGRTAMTFGRR